MQATQFPTSGTSWGFSFIKNFMDIILLGAGLVVGRLVMCSYIMTQVQFKVRLGFGCDQLYRPCVSLIYINIRGDFHRTLAFRFRYALELVKF